MINFFYRTIEWFKSQVLQIRNSKTNVLNHKIKKLILFSSIFILTLIFFPLFLIIRLLSKFILIRFAKLDSRRIGHFASEVNTYLCTFKKKTKFQYDFFYAEKPLCNNVLLKMYRRYINVLPRILIEPLILLNSVKFFGNSKHNINLNQYILPKDSTKTYKDFKFRGTDDLRDRDKKDEKKINYFNQKDLETGYSFLKDLGLNKNDKFVCLLCRDEGYTKKVFSETYDFLYESKGDTSTHRNSNIENFRLVSEYLMDLGYHVFRMGDENSKPFLINDKRFTDYTVLKKKNEFLDIFLASYCDFFISTGSGLDTLASIQDRPIVFVNYAMFAWARSTNKKQLTIFKHFKNKNDFKNLSLSEIFNLHLAQAQIDEPFKVKQVEVIENTPEEIKDAVIDMLELIKNDFVVSDENKYSQSKFWNNFMKKIDENNLNNLHSNFVKAHIGFTFLKKNNNLLK